MIDAVLSFHMNPATCGTHKFNLRLARELGVPCLQVESKEARKVTYPLLSLRHHECPLYAIRMWWDSFDVFLHEWTGDESVTRWFRDYHPMRVFAGNAEIARKVKPIRPDVISAFCPSTIDGNPSRGAINVLTFGMAHKLQPARYAKLKQLLDATGQDYTVSVSTAIHEGSPWDETAVVGDRLRAIFGDRLRVLGYLGDDALVREMAQASAIAIFFDPAVRANNTTFWAAYKGCGRVITNFDGDSPCEVRGAGVGIVDIDTLIDWPWRSLYTAQWGHLYTWEHLKDLVCANSASVIG